MLKSKQKVIGKDISELKIGERITLTEKIEDKDLLLYLAMTNDINPLYVQHDYAVKTAYEQPIVPTIMLTGIVSSAVSKHLPGAGAHIMSQHLHFPKPVHHYALVEFVLEVTNLNETLNQVTISVKATDENKDCVMTGEVIANAPQKVVVTRTAEKE